jgi:drug/metabolite transporter (DMT)-like permease
MFGQRGHWDLLRRGRVLGSIWIAFSIFLIILGIYFLVTQGNWLVLILAIGALLFALLMVWDNERKNRADPENDST